MTRASILAGLLAMHASATARASPAEPAPSVDLQLYGVSETVALTGSFGLGAELSRDRDALSFEAVAGGLPFCFGACVLVYWGDLSAAYHRQLTEKVFIGPRVVMRYLSALPGDAGSSLREWWRVAVAEVGLRRRSGSWTVTTALGAGALWRPDGGIPTVTMRVTLGR